MKTAKEYFNQLPEPFKTQALKNRKESIKNLPKKELSILEVYEYPTFRDALYAGFVWANTPQGHDYWSTIQYNK